MEEPFLMRAISYDSVLLSTDKTIFQFFTDEDDEPGDRFNKQIEMDMVHWILNNQFDHNQSLLYDELNIPKTFKFFMEVKKPIIKDADMPGDIDILAVDKNNPHLSVGIQVKRFKANIDGYGKTGIKMSSLKTGVQQARHMFEKYRFHQNYLMFLIAADTVNRDKSQLFRFLSLDEKKAIYQHHLLKDLPTEVGIFTYEVSQPSKNPLHHTGILASKVLRAANKVEQPSETTESILEYLKECETF